jgi:CheY-like chemotaxis protein
MAPTEQPVLHRVLLVDDVDDDDGVRAMVYATLEPRGFDVVAPASVTEALRHIATQSLDGFITDLHMPDPGDGFTVVTAMRPSPRPLLHSRNRRGSDHSCSEERTASLLRSNPWVWTMTMTMTAANDEGGAKKFQGSAQLESAKAVPMLPSRRLPTAVRYSRRIETEEDRAGNLTGYRSRRRQNLTRPRSAKKLRTMHTWLRDTVNSHPAAEAAKLRAEQCDCHAATAAEQGTTKKSAASLRDETSVKTAERS